MIDNELEQDEIDVTDDTPDLLNVGPDSDEPEDIIEQDEPPVSKSTGKPSTAIAEEELPTIESKQKEREALERAMQEFLARGGKVQTLDSE